MKKVVGLERQDSAVGYYRIINPLRFLKREGIISETRMLPFTGDLQMQKFQFNDKTLIYICKDADVILTDMIWRDDDFLKILDIRKWSGAKWVMDVDDNIFGVQHDNPAHQGVQNVLPAMQRSLRMADGLVVSVPPLKTLYQSLNPHIYIQYNGIDFSWFDTLTVKKHKGIRIGWRGAAGHNYDRELVEPAMRRITKDYPGTIFVVFQQLDPHYDFPYEHQEFVPFPDYFETLASLGLDIFTIPLLDTSYNRCKSNIAYLESSALKIPSVISPLENQNGMKALYADTNYEWYKHIAYLIDHLEERKKLGQKAYDFLKGHPLYDMKKSIYPFAEWLTSLPRRSDYDNP